MSERRVTNPTKVSKQLTKLGAVVARQSGSHRVYQFMVDGKVVASSVVPQHRGDMPKGTARAIERDFEAVFGQGWMK